VHKRDVLPFAYGAAPAFWMPRLCCFVDVGAFEEQRAVQALVTLPRSHKAVAAVTVFVVVPVGERIHQFLAAKRSSDGFSDRLADTRMIRTTRC
jgi:hypothetical protein